MKKLFASLTIAAALIAPAFAHAGTLYGSFGIVFNGVTVQTTNSGGSLFPASNVQSISFTSADFSMGSGNPLFPANVTGTITGSTTFVPAGTGYTMTFGNYGTFTQVGVASVFSNGQVGNNSAVAYDVAGIFTPGSYFAGYTGGASDFVLQFNKNGAYSGSGTFSIDATTVPGTTPEPSSLALLGTGLLGAVGAARRRFKA